ncbi:hypothetical protein KAR91_02375 [Candidatus Pacearchaeota archaeon]|nr:hypothetical protein [Candidatus Pacearchaeota archaeon]
MAKQPFNVKIKDEKETKKIFSTDFPNYARFAIANTASRVAFLGVEKAEDEMRKDFFLRNKYIVGSKPGKGAVKFNRAIPHHDINKISSSWGSPEKQGRKDFTFLEEQEEGFTHSGPVPTEKARISKNQKKRIKRANYLSRVQRRNPDDMAGLSALSGMAKTWAFLRASYKDGFGLPGSDQFFFLRHTQLPPGMTEGWFQFSSSNPKAGDSFPRWKQVFYKKKSENRRAVHWMENSKNKITASEIDKIYTEEAARSFTKQITKMK